MDDLSEGVPTEGERKKDDAMLRLLNQRFEQRRLIFCVGSTIAVCLVIFFLYFAWTIIRLLETGTIHIVEWPLVAIGSITVLSALTLLISLARLSYLEQASKSDDSGSEAQPVELLQKVLDIVKAAGPDG